MEEILKILNDAKVFFVATTEDDKPRVRPFGFAMIFEGKLYFCTGNHKNVYRQLKTNPNLEICAMITEDEWIRINGKAVFDDRQSPKEKVFELCPSLYNIYSSAEDPRFEVFYLTDCEAVIYSMTDEPRKIEI